MDCLVLIIEYRSTGNKRTYQHLARSHADSSYFKLLETFTESCPQLVVQIFIICNGPENISCKYNVT